VAVEEGIWGAGLNALVDVTFIVSGAESGRAGSGSINPEYWEI